MSSRVRLTSLEELETFKSAMVKFVDDAQDSLLAVDLTLRRFVEWLRHEQPQLLHRAHLAVMDEVAGAKSALHRKKLAKVGDREPDTTEEEAALRRAVRKREEIERRISMVKRWGQMIEQPLSEYRGQSQQLGTLLDGNPPKCVALLDHAVRRLHEYLEVQAPRVTGEESAGSMARSPESLPEVPDEPTDEEVSP